MTSTDRLPAFIIIGAVKGATTWIAHQLRVHPLLWLPDAEPHYFSTEYDQGADWYRKWFDNAPEGRILGEKSADYLAHPDAPSRIAAVVPDVRMIVQLRDPVERAYSDYCMLYRRGLVGANPLSYLDRSRAADSRFLAGGLYAAHLERYFEKFAREQICVLLYEDIQRSPEAVIDKVCGHIGVAPHIAPVEVASRKNDSAAPMLPLALRRILRPARKWLDPMRSDPVLSRLRASLAAPVRYPPLDDELRATLVDFYRDDVRRLEDILGRDLSGWTRNEARLRDEMANENNQMTKEEC